jgi:hypothetical protein
LALDSWTLDFFRPLCAKGCGAKVQVCTKCKDKGVGIEAISMVLETELPVCCATTATILRKSMMSWFRSSASKSTPSAEPAPSLPLPDVESYKILDHLHLGLNVKIGATYSRQELEARCKGNEPHCKVRVQWVLWWLKMEKMLQYRNIMKC